MKTKIILLLVFLSLSITSCFKDYIGHGSDKIKLTAENNIYEGDLYQTYLSIEIERITAEIFILDDIIKNNQGTEQTEKDLENAKLLRNSLEDEQDSTLIPDFLFRRIPRPRPPCPSPQNCDFFNFDFVTSLNETQLKSIMIFDANANEIGGTTGNQNVLSGTNRKAIVDDFKIDSKYSGSITVKVVTGGGKRLIDTYTFDSFIEK